MGKISAPRPLRTNIACSDKLSVKPLPTKAF